MNIPASTRRIRVTSEQQADALGALAIGRPDLAEKIDSLKSKIEIRENLMQMLERSILIQSIWPFAFEAGSCRTTITGSPAAGFTFKVTRDDHEIKTWPLEFAGFIYQGRNKPGRPMLGSAEVPKLLIDHVLDQTHGKEI